MNRRFLNTILACLAIALAFSLPAQNVGINDDNSTPDANAMLDVKSTTKGALFPRMTTAQRNTLGALNPTEGMLVFDTDIEAYFYFTNSAWAQLSAGTGSAVPVGTIMAYGGTTVPAGYLACNGSSVSNATYPALFAAIGTSWGGNGAPDFNLPDLRGRFPRGWDNGAGNDPDAGSRTNLHVGGQTGDNVGSYQLDAFQGHHHNIVLTTRASEAGEGGLTCGSGSVQNPGSNYASSAISDGGNGTPRVSSETRPKNAYVQYIIKY